MKNNTLTSTNTEDIILYHASRTGIADTEHIVPTSRDICDFGRGFYMCANVFRAKTLVAEQKAPVLYTVKFRLSEITNSRILFLNDRDWLRTVLLCRRLSDKYASTTAAQEWKKTLEKYDVIIGKPVNDLMLETLQAFAKNYTSDEAVLECLDSVSDLQYVAKTEFACSKIEIVNQETISENELKKIQLQANENRFKALDVIRKSNFHKIREGMFLEEILKNMQNEVTEEKENEQS